MRKTKIKTTPIVTFFAREEPNGLRKTFGILKGWKKSGQQIKDELRRELHFER